MFGDEIEDLIWIDSLTGEMLNKTPRATIFPKTHYVTTEKN